MRTYFSLFVLAIFGLTASAQMSDNTLLRVANEDVSIDDFLNIYNKNRQAGEELDSSSLDEYMDLFINFKLKVKEAESLGMDTVSTFVNELEGYRKQLAKPYLVDSEVGNQLVYEAYARLKEEVRASHILITIGEDASPADTLKAYNKIQSIRNEIASGANFAQVAKSKSQDPSVAQNEGDLGFFTALYMVYPFENAAYNTPVGELSNIIRTRFGYHILKVTDRRPSRGEVKAAHIMVKFDKTKGANDDKHVLETKGKIEEIYSKLVNEGADFSEMAAQYSDDKNNANKGGELPWFGTNRMVASFEEATFALSQIGDISRPVQTPYGWHIIKLVDKKGLGSFDTELTELKKKVEKDSRSQAKTVKLVNKLKKEYNYKLDQASFHSIKKWIDKDFIFGEKQANNNFTKTLFSLSSQTYSQNQFLIYLEGVSKGINPNTNISNFVDKQLQNWVSKEVLDFENEQLEHKYDEFRLLMQEYRDGILLYELTDEKIWSKAVKDTLGLQEFHAQNRDDYMWNTRVNASVINFQDECVAKKVRKKLYKKKANLDQIQTKINKKSHLAMDVKTDVFLKGDNSFVDAVNWEVGVSEIIADNNNYKLVYITDVIDPQPKLLSEAKGLITSDYQNYLEQEWLNELKDKYEVEINERVFELLKTNKLHLLKPVIEPEVSSSIPNYKGHFNKAFSKALRDLGSSSNTIFEWYGSYYTTELK